MKFRAKLLLVVLLLALIIPAQAQDAEKSITVIFDQELDTLNPIYSNMFFMGVVTDLYLLPAWSFNDELQPVPRLVAEMPSFENGGISEDGRVITLKLREGMTWSDGDPLDSADFVFTYEMHRTTANVIDSSYPYGENDLNGSGTPIVASIEAPDATTVVINFNEPFVPWLTNLFTTVLPQHILGPVFEADGTIDNADWNRAATVGSGPFVFAEWESGSFIRFVRNENYWDQLPVIDQVVIRFIPDSEAYIASLMNGEADLGTFLDWGDINAVEETGLYEIQIAPSGYNEQWNINVNPETGHPALQDIRVREALVLATNREQITNDLLYGLTFPPASPWEATPYQSPNVSIPPYDPERAAALLEEAGWVDSNGDGTRDKDGVELMLRYVTNQRGIRVDTQAVVQQMLAEVGVGTELINHPSDLFFAGYGQGGPVALGEYDIAQWSQSTQFPDPNTSVFLCDQIPTPDSPEGNNLRGYCNPALDALFAQQNEELDPEVRVEIFHQISETLAADFVWVGIWHDPDNWEVNKRLQNVRINAFYPFWNVSEWDVTE